MKAHTLGLQNFSFRLWHLFGIHLAAYMPPFPTNFVGLLARDISFGKFFFFGPVREHP